MFLDHVPLVLSSGSRSALRARARELGRHLADHPGADLAAFAGVLAASDPGLRHRAVVIASDTDQARRRLADLAAGHPADGTFTGAPAREQRPVLVYPGQGSQWTGMGLDLLEHSPVFRDELHACDKALSEFADWSLLDVVRGAPGAPELDGAAVVQPVLFAVMLALSALWRSYGVEPAAVIGHSLGEVAAATAVGALSREDGMRVSALWSQAQATLSGRGEMISVPLPLDDVEALVAGRDGLGLAGVNGPSWTVVSGDRDAALGLLEDLRADGVRARLIPVGLAAHSRHIEDVRERLLADLGPLAPRPAGTPLYSTVTDDPREVPVLDAAYWYRNLRSTVRFDRATRAAVADGHGVLVEVSPHPVLTVGLHDTIDDLGAEAAVLASMRRGEDGRHHFLAALAEAYTHGVPVAWPAVLPGPLHAPEGPGGLVPGDIATASAQPGAGTHPAHHPLLETAVELAGEGGHLFTGALSRTTHPWLADHTLLGRDVVPAACLVELALHAGAELGTGHLAALTQHFPAVLPDGVLQIQVRVAGADEDGARRVEIHSRPERALRGSGEDWICHATGTLTPRTASGGPAADPGTQWPPRGAEPLDPSAGRARLTQLGYGLGPAFDGLRAAWSLGQEVLAEAVLPHEAGSGAPFVLHPALLDAALQAVALFPAAAAEATAWLPADWRDVTPRAFGAGALRVRVTPSGADSLSLTATDDTGRTVATVGYVAMEPVDTAHLAEPWSGSGPAPGAARDSAAGARGGLAGQLAALDADQGRALLEDVVRGHTADVLGLGGTGAVPADRPFKEFGFDSLTAVALRNRLVEATGLKLRTTLVFDFPTPAVLAAHLGDQLAPRDRAVDTVLRDLEQLERSLHATADEQPVRGRIRARLQDLLFRLDGAADDTADPADHGDPLDAATDEEIFDLLNKELDRP